MNDARVVRELERLANLRHDAQRFTRRNAAVAEQLPEVDAVNKFHEEIKQAVALAELVERDDVRMIEFRKRTGFARETFGKGRAASLRRQDFQGHDAVQLFLASFIDRAHTALTDKFEDFQLWKFRGQFFDFGRGKTRRFTAGIRPDVHTGAQASLEQALGA